MVSYKIIINITITVDWNTFIGTIGGYGVCSNTMALPAAADHVSFKDVLSACDKPDNFVAIEAPVNLFEREVVFGDQKTVSDIAKVSYIVGST